MPAQTLLLDKFPTTLLDGIGNKSYGEPMNALTDATLIARIEHFLDRTKMKPTRFGLDAMGDGALLNQLRAGRSLSLKNAEKVLKFIDEHEAEPTCQSSEG